MKPLKTAYDAVIIGAGHNGLVAAAYLGQAGLSTLILERNAVIGGATRSARPFSGIDAKLSVYSYLVSLFPQAIVEDLGLNLNLRSRRIASYTPRFEQDQWQELLVSNESEAITRHSFHSLPGGQQDYAGYQQLQILQNHLAKKLWPTMLKPLQSKATLLAGLDREERNAWDALIENPLGNVIESLISNDLVRGMLFTDAKIGVSTYPKDPSLLQNLTYLYHIIGRGTGEWRVPVGGMGSLTSSLEHAAISGGAKILTRALATEIHLNNHGASIAFEHDDQTETVDCRFVLNNAAPTVLNRLLGKPNKPKRPIDEGSVIKINILLNSLPKLRSGNTSSSDAFSGTFHLDEGYEQMSVNYHQALSGQLPDRPSGEMYCHSLTDGSILSKPLRDQAFQALTLFGLDMPYALFAADNEGQKRIVLERYLQAINRYTLTPIHEHIANDSEGNPCIEIKSPVDLERDVHLPRGNIFHNALTWPFTEDSSKVGTWGVETAYPKIFTCGSGARRGGAVSGIPGHNAAKKLLSCL